MRSIIENNFNKINYLNVFNHKLGHGLGRVLGHGKSRLSPLSHVGLCSAFAISSHSAAEVASGLRVLLFERAYSSLSCQRVWAH